MNIITFFKTNSNNNYAFRFKVKNIKPQFVLLNFEKFDKKIIKYFDEDILCISNFFTLMYKNFNNITLNIFYASFDLHKIIIKPNLL